MSGDAGIAPVGGRTVAAIARRRRDEARSDGRSRLGVDRRTRQAFEKGRCIRRCRVRNELFRLGVPPTTLDGPTDGLLVMTTTNPALDAAVRAVAGLWMPWQAQAFSQRGCQRRESHGAANTVVSKLLRPLYSHAGCGSAKLAFDFKTYVEAGKDDPDRQVLVIDYADIESNPRLLIRSIRDELVEIVDSVFLRKDPVSQRFWQIQQDRLLRAAHAGLEFTNPKNIYHPRLFTKGSYR